tara:strand:+ start:46 stop:735 length:690 start_codon:yes stop_codon:yes gene_type:complete
MINYYARVKDALGYGSKYYNGYLIKYFDNLFSNLEKNIITPDSAKLKVRDLFKSDKNLKYQFLNLLREKKAHLNIIGSKLRPFHRIRIGIINLDMNKYEPIHYHDGFISFQIVLSGKCLLHEFDKTEIFADKIQYTSYKEQILYADDVMLNCSKYRDIHGFGAIDEPVSILSIGKYYGIFGKFKFSRLKLMKNNRDYLDIDKQKSVGNTINESPLIDENLAYRKYSKIL